MEENEPTGAWQELVVPVALGVAAIVVLPLILAGLDGVPPERTLTLVGSALVIEYGAGAVGIALGISPITTFLILASTGLGLVVLLFAIFDTLGRKSGRVAGFLKKTESRMERHPFIRKWGILALFPGVVIVGIYFVTPVAWILRWETRRSIFLILAGYLAAGVVTLLGTLGIFRLLSL